VADGVEGITGGLTAKAGPLPVWGWAVLVSVPIIGYRIYSSRKAAAAAAAAASSTPTQTADSYPLTGVPGTTDSTAGALYPSLYNPGGIYTGDAGTTGTTLTTPTTNNDWRNVAADKLVAAGYSPTDVNTALVLILNGQPVTPQQEALFNEAVRAVGSNPPEGVPPITLAAADTGATTPTTPTGPSPGDTGTVVNSSTGEVVSSAQFQHALAAGTVDPPGFQDWFSSNGGGYLATYQSYNAAGQYDAARAVLAQARAAYIAQTSGQLAGASPM
jgi:hypothetical protein